jgi:hypothetical protein
MGLPDPFCAFGERSIWARTVRSKDVAIAACQPSQLKHPVPSPEERLRTGEKTFGRGPGACVRRVWTSCPSSVSGPSDLAGVGRQHPEHDAHGGGLAGSVGADEPERLPLGNGE